jgi:Tol biopolymer transport system component
MLRTLLRTLSALSMCLSFTVAAEGSDITLDHRADVGRVDRPGAVAFDRERGEYRITGSGANIWNKEDAFHFAWREVAGDLIMTAEVSFVGPGKDPHRKAGWMVREGTDADAPYADVAVHGDGLIELQYRKERGGLTRGIRTPVKAPASVRLERTGDLFTLFVATKGGPFQTVGSVTVALKEPLAAGLFVCSHDASVSETAIFSGVSLSTRVLPPGQKRVRESCLEIVSVPTGARRLVHRAIGHFEAPNWSRDGKSLLVNAGGKIFTIPVEGGSLTPLDTGGLSRCNNDHGYSPDGRWLAVSHRETNASLIYVLPSAGGTARKVTLKGPSYWHGWSPDGKTLAYCAERNGAFDVYTTPVEGGPETRLTDAPGLDDGPDYAPDGQTLYWNSERTGVMKIWRMRPDGTAQEPVTSDPAFADWFPHPSPDGRLLVFLSYDAAVNGHPEDKDVVLRLLTLPSGTPKVLATLFGGQGTINVPSWSPDGSSLAFVSYRLVIP